MKRFDFVYSCKVRKNGDELDILGYNSPYSNKQDSHSIDDIKQALLKDKIIELVDGKETELNFLCRFIENKDGSFNQIFIKNES